METQQQRAQLKYTDRKNDLNALLQSNPVYKAFMDHSPKKPSTDTATTFIEKNQYICSRFSSFATNEQFIRSKQKIGQVGDSYLFRGQNAILVMSFVKN